MRYILALFLLAGVGCSDTSHPTVGPRPCSACGETHVTYVPTNEFRRCSLKANAAAVEALQGIEHTLRQMLMLQAQEADQ